MQEILVEPTFVLAADVLDVSLSQILLVRNQILLVQYELMENAYQISEPQ